MNPFAFLSTLRNNPIASSKPMRLASMLLVCVLALGGCAAQEAYREGVVQSEAGNHEAALRQFEKASALESGSAQYKISVQRARANLATEHERRYDELIAKGLFAEARSLFEASLRQTPNSDQMHSRLQAAQAAKRHEQWMVEAQRLAAKGPTEGAKVTVRRILSENPQHAEANKLLSQWEQAEASASPSNPGSLNEGFQTPITIEFKDAPLKTVFEVISRISGLNFVFDKDVRTDQKTSIYLKNSNVEAALQLTLLTNQLARRVLDGNSVLIYPNSQAKQKDYQPLTVKVFYLANAEAKTVAASLKTLLKTRDVVVDDKMNMIIMRDSPEAVRLAEKLVAVQDLAEPEVMLEVEVLEVKRSKLMDLGVRWPDQLSLNPIAADGANLTLADLWSVTRDRTGRTIGAAVGSADIRAKKTDSDSDILANPRIRVRNRDKARILIGDRVPNITSTSTSTGFVAESISYVDVGLKLDVEPIIYVDGDVAIKMSLEVSNLVEQVATKSGSIAYRIGTRSAQTVLRLRDGENQVLAGLISNEDRRSANKVPGLGELPIAGRLFGNQLDDNSRTEIVLSITPRVLRNIARPGAHALEFASGTESDFGGQAPAPSSGNAPKAQTPNSTQPTNAGSVDPSDKSKAPQPSPEAGSSNPSASAPPAPAASATSSAKISWQAPSTVSRSQNFTIQLTLQSDTPVLSVPVSMGFDPTTVQVVSVQEGDLLKQGGTASSFVHRIDPSGQILFTSTRSGNGVTGNEGGSNGTVASITFRVTSPAASETRFQLQAVAPVGAGGRALNTPLPPPQVVAINP